ncbi:hypothetical protein NDU88_003871 [Pleurodeles waltl]|uniref:Uncharacterized protein n=1 Tax=Pleurodeles waltl TaxID=8319 RepID=A0AAV7UZP0_PLEWA|nr:hypothetical protein NDU88_003871 [Pleurodeles waltl]
MQKTHGMGRWPLRVATRATANLTQIKYVLSGDPAYKSRPLLGPTSVSLELVGFLCYGAPGLAGPQPAPRPGCLNSGPSPLCSTSILPPHLLLTAARSSFPDDRSWHCPGGNRRICPFHSSTGALWGPSTAIGRAPLQRHPAAIFVTVHLSLPGAVRAHPGTAHQVERFSGARVSPAPVPL